MFSALLLVLAAQQSAPQAAPAPLAPPLPSLSRALRGAELVAYGRVLQVVARRLETAEGRPFLVRPRERDVRLAEVEIREVLKGDATIQRLWLLAEPYRNTYDLDLSKSGGSALLFLTLGEDPAPEAATYLEKSSDCVWRSSGGKLGWAPVQDEADGRSVGAPAIAFGPEDGELAGLPRGSDGRVARVPAPLLDARIRALAAAQRATWIRAAASGGDGEFAWELELRLDRSATLTIQRAQGPEPREVWCSLAIMGDLEARLAERPSDLLRELGTARERGLVRRLEIAGGEPILIRTVDRDWIAEPAHKQAARWTLGFYNGLRSCIREPGLLDGRAEDRPWWR